MAWKTAEAAHETVDTAWKMIDKAREMADRIRESVAFIRESGIEHEFRTLLLPASYFSAKDMEALKSIADETLKVRAFRGGNCLDETWNQYTSTHIP